MANNSARNVKKPQFGSRQMSSRALCLWGSLGILGTLLLAGCARRSEPTANTDEIARASEGSGQTKMATFPCYLLAYHKDSQTDVQYVVISGGGRPMPVSVVLERGAIASSLDALVSKLLELPEGTKVDVALPDHFVDPQKQLTQVSVEEIESIRKKLKTGSKHISLVE